MKVVIGADHGGYELKQTIIEFLNSKGHEVIDVGTHTTDSCDYPDIVKKLVPYVRNEGYRGILVCGTGIGMSIAANKYDKIRAALCSDTFSARLTREHNDSNILCLGQRVLGSGLAIDIVEAWMNTEFSNGQRHKNRLQLIDKIEKERD